MINLPIAFLLSAFFPTAIIIILIFAILFLAYEGVEKIYAFFFPHRDSKDEIIKRALPEEEIETFEKEKIKSAIVTDFILSVGIVMISLGTVINETLSSQIIVVLIIAIMATICV